MNSITLFREDLKNEQFEILMEKLQKKKVKENIQNQVKQHQDNVNKNPTKTQKQLNELKTSANFKIKQKRL
jgi:hypothetical protein